MRDALGKLNHHAAEIIHHREQHATNVIYLFRGDGICLGGFQLADGGHIAHAVNKRHNRLTDAVTQHVFTHHFGICQREEQRGLQRFEIHVQHGENFNHLNAAPQQQFGIGMSLRCAQTIGPGFG
ncbi:hypothetical protein D3C72_896370 [compost metagenome]